MDSGNVKALTFDVFATLFDWHGSLAPKVRNFLQCCGVSLDTDAFLQAWRVKQFVYMLINTTMGLERYSFLDITRRSLLYVLKTNGIETSLDKLSELVATWDDFDPFPEVDKAVSEIKRRGYLIAPFSNGDRKTIEKLCGKLSTRFDAILSSEDAGVYKPHPRFYQLASKTLGLKMYEILHVAAGPFDIIGSKSVGMMTVWVNRRGLIFEELDYRPDFEVKDFNGLLEILPSRK